MIETTCPLDSLQPNGISILVLAAGAATRMRGGDKLLEDVGGIALLQHVVLVAQSTGLPVVVTQAADWPMRSGVLAGLDVKTVDVCGDMSASLRAGLGAINPTHAVMVLLADMPEIDRHDLSHMISAHHRTPELIHRACDENGMGGHPVLFPVWARAELMRLQGDTGAKAVLAAHTNRIGTVALPGLHATTDLDTPEAWARWRSAQITDSHS